MAYTQEQIDSTNALLQKGNVLGTLASQQTGVAFTPTPITSSVLDSQPEIPYQTPQSTPTYPVATLNQQMQDTFALTAPEQQAQTTSDQLQGLNQQLVGESAYRAGQETAQNIQGLTQTQNDLTSRLTALKNEALAIPLQIDQEAQGRGVTAGGMRPIEASALRKNAIQALSVNSLLEASRGNLTTALALVDRAVAQKYDPIREEIAAKTANLQLILQSPSYSMADKKRAQKQLDIQTEKTRQLEVEASNQSTIQGLALQALQNGAPAAVVDKIMMAKDLSAAFQAAQGFAAKETVASIQEYNFAVRNGYKGSYTDYQNEDANRKIAIARAGVANGEFGLSSTQANLFNSIVTKYNASPLVAAADRTPVLKNSIQEARDNPSDGPTQLNLIYSYVQALDTYQSAVREGELSLVNSIDSKKGKIQNYVSQIENGQIVRPEVIKEIADAAENIVNTINQAAKAKADSYKSQASVIGLGPVWDKYQSGFSASYNQPVETDPNADFKAEARAAGYSEEEIAQYLAGQQ